MKEKIIEVLKGHLDDLYFAQGYGKHGVMEL